VSATCARALAKPVAYGVTGEASRFYFERDFARHAVKIMPGEFFVTKEDVVLSTVLGSCVAACIWDRVAKIGGMNHFMLPDAEAGLGLTGASGRYGVYAMERLTNELIKRGATKTNLEAKVFGGAWALGACSMVNVGERNASFVLQFLKTEGIRVVSQDLLGVYARRVAFFPANGRALCKRLNKTDSSAAAAEQQYCARINATEVAGDVELF